MKWKDKIDSISILSRNIKIEGDISGDENFKIEGAIKGSIEVFGDILVEETGIVEADMNGDNIVVKGQVQGNISAKNRIEIYASGKVIGDISARSVDIQEGATFEGRSKMLNTGSINNKAQIYETDKNDQKGEESEINTEV